MKRLMAFIRKEFLHIFRDYRTLIILFGLPAAQILIFGYAVRTDLTNAGIAVLDNSRDEVSRDLILKLDASRFFDIKYVITSYSIHYTKLYEFEISCGAGLEACVHRYCGGSNCLYRLSVQSGYQIRNNFV